VQVFSSANVLVGFKVSKQVNYGESVKLVGSGSALGDWDVSAAPEMRWTDGDVWVAELELPAEEDVHFKYVCVHEGGEYWENCADHNLKVSAVSVHSNWDDQHLDVQHSSTGNQPEQQPEVHEEPKQTVHPEGGDQASGSGSTADERLQHNQWQGADVEFMQSNNHKRERNGVWDTTGLEGAALHIVSSDQKAASWLGKIEAVKKLLVDQAPEQKPELDALAVAYVYLQWIGTGAIQCAEGGGHYRPNRHAELSRIIFTSLERVIGDPAAAGTRALLARRMHPKLPSFTEAYTASVPFTRIRDIAHRNDIPHDLKQEIKHTIQNKLHRNAGPEDLVATERMIERLEAEGGYNDSFMNEFRVFRGELRDFFNASSFTDMLDALRPSLDDADTPALDNFVKAKAKLDSSSESSMNDIVDTLHRLTTVRVILSSGLASGLRNDAPESSLAMRQRWRLAEGRSEDYAFVLLSQLTNMLEAQGGPAALAKGEDAAWALPIGAAVLAIRHVGLSGWEPRECAAVENELTAWQQLGEFSLADNALRLKATLERAQRLTQSYTDGLLAVLPETANALGKALGIREEQVQVFTEAEVRASVVFQLSSLLAVLQKAARTAADCDEWDAIVAGEAVGTLVEVGSMEEAKLAAGGDTVLLVRSATGDEEVGAMGGALKGVILCHSLPHLSHLGVRARQERVTFATVEDDGLLQSVVRPLVGRRIKLTAGAAGVQLSEYDGPAASGEGASAAASAPGSPAASGGTINKAKTPELLKLADAKAETCGAKAAACAALERSAGSQYLTPKGAVFPFGTMDLAIQEANVEKDYEQLLEKAETADAEEVATICQQLQDLVSQLRPDASVLASAGKELGAKTRAYVRSSANVEDMEGMSGAGLYESVPDVHAASAEDLGAAVAQVWASLYTRRAVLTRRAAGVKQSDASMAVLAMEMLAPQASFVLHTASPLDRDEKTLHAEVAPGLGETLASGTRGSPWRLVVDKASGTTTMTSFANFSSALVAPTASSKAARFQLVSKTLDFSKEDLSRSADARSQLGQKLSKIGVALEDAFGGPQDVEGAIVGDDIYIVQSRPQP